MTKTRLRTLLLPLVAALLLLAWTSSGRAGAAPAATTATTATTKTEGVPAFGHVFTIIGENTELGQVNKTNAPYLIGTLKPTAAWLTDYFAVTHFSEANYAAMTSGQFTRCQQFDGSIASCHQQTPNLFRQLTDASVSWRSWMESMPTPCQVTSAGAPKTLNHYAPKHNPAVFYDDVEGLGGVWSADPAGQSQLCKTQDIPTGSATVGNDMSGFDTALAHAKYATFPRFNYIVPNECEDGHDNCQPQGNGVTQFDAFLAREVPKIMSSPAFGPDGLLIITYDEGTSNQGPGSSKQFDGGGNVIFAALGPLVRQGTYGGTFNHYSLLRTWEDGFGISEHAGLAGDPGTSPINTIWR